MRIFIVQLLFLTIFLGNTKAQSIFPGLKKIDVKHFNGIELHLDPASSEIYNQKRIDLNSNNKFFTDMDCESIYMTLIAIVKIDNSSEKKYAITYSNCPEGEFTIYDAESPDSVYGSIIAEKLYITGNQNLYSSGYTNNTFNIKRKFRFTNNQLIEVDQQYYFVGIKCFTLNPIILYKSQKLEEEILQLPTNYPIEIVLSQQSHNSTEGLYLLKTKFGLLGWTILNAGQYKAIDVDSLIYKGD